MKNKVKNRLKPKKYDHWQEYQKVKKRAYRIVGGATVAVWVLLLIIKLAVAARSGLPFSEAFRTIGDGIFDNILGILPPILLFDFGLEYIQQDKVYEEMTEQITGTIMSRPEVINSFDFDAKKRFVDATVLSMVDMDKDECAMALGAIEPYLNDKYDIKTRFEYFIDINDCDCFDCFKPEKYMLVCEQLSYNITYIATEPIGKCVHLGFFSENKELDRKLRHMSDNSQNEKEKRFVIREALTVDIDDLNAFISGKNDAELKEAMETLFSPSLYIDDKKWELGDFEITEKGIDFSFNAGEDFYNAGNKSNKIMISFRMPQLKAHTSFLASISQPVYSPTIRFNYPAEKYDVKMYPFFNNSVEASVEQAELGVGNCYININEKWVHPMSGVVFMINGK